MTGQRRARSEVLAYAIQRVVSIKSIYAEKDMATALSTAQHLEELLRNPGDIIIQYEVSY